MSGKPASFLFLIPACQGRIHIEEQNNLCKIVLKKDSGFRYNGSSLFYCSDMEFDQFLHPGNMELICNILDCF